MTTGSTIVTCAFIVASMFITMLPSTIAQAPALTPLGVPIPAASPGLLGVPVPAVAPGPAMDCQTALFGMSDCLGFVTTGSNETKPDPACCPELSGLLDSQPNCLCLLLGDTEATFGIQIDLSKAVTLPSTCGLKTPSLSMCPAAPSPGGVPTSSEGPAYSPGGTPPGVAASPGSAANGDNGAVTSGLTFLVCLAIAFSTTLF